MPGLTDAGEDNVLDAIYNAETTGFPAGDPYIALHTGDPGENGTTNEVVGGSYARQQAPFSASSGGTVTNTGTIDWLNMPAVTVVAWSAWSAVSGGTCYQTAWVSTVSGLGVVRSADLAGNDVQSVAHGLLLDDRVAFDPVEGLTLPTGLASGTLYWVVSGGLTTDAFDVSASQGGADVDITAAGSCVWRKVTPKPITGGDTFRFAAGDLDIFATE